MPKTSAGIIIYRKGISGMEVLLLHPGGPFWKNKDDGAWTISKGEMMEGEEALSAAIRELKEETGIHSNALLKPLRPVKLPGGKLVNAWAAEMEVDASSVKSNYFEMEWPPHSGKKQQFPEMDRAQWFSLEQAKKKIIKGQLPFLDELAGMG